MDSCSLETQVNKISFSSEDDNDYLNTQNRIIDSCRKNSKYTSIKGIDATDILKFINSEYVDITDGMEWDRKDDNVTKQQFEII